MMQVYRDAGLRVEYIENFYGSHDLVFFETNELTVDGIRSILCGPGYILTVTRNLMIGVKEDTYGDEDKHVRADGYMHSDYANWSSPSGPKSYASGDIDEEVFIYTGLVIGVNDPDYPDARRIADNEIAYRKAKEELDL